MATFELRVRTISGSVQHVQVNPETQIREVLTQFAPPYHAAKFFEGESELGEGTVAETIHSSEVMVVLTLAPEKAMAEVLENIESLFGSICLTFPPSFGFNLAECHELINTPAVQFLREVTDLNPNLCRSLFTAILWCPQQWRPQEHFPSRAPEWFQVWGQEWGAICGRCMDLDFLLSHCPGMLEESHYNPLQYEGDLGLAIRLSFVISALGEAAVRQNEISCRHESQLAGIAEAFFLTIPGLNDRRYNWRTSTEVACQLLIKYGNVAMVRVLKDVQPPLNCIEALKTTIEHMERRWSANVSEEQDADGLQCIATDVSASRQPHALKEGACHVIMEDTSRMAEDSITDAGLDEALRQSETELLHEEQAQLQEALILNKEANQPQMANFEDATANSPCDDVSVLLLLFGRFPGEFRNALLSSPLAERLRAAGVELEPEWAKGRIILAEGMGPLEASEAREHWHVMVQAVNEKDIYNTLHGLGHDVRPRLKQDVGRFLVPKGDSLFNDISQSSAVDEVASIDAKAAGTGEPTNATGGNIDMLDCKAIPVFRTFLHVPFEPITSPRTALSAPAGF